MVTVLSLFDRLDVFLASRHIVMQTEAACSSICLTVIIVNKRRLDLIPEGGFKWLSEGVSGICSFSLSTC